MATREIALQDDDSLAVEIDRLLSLGHKDPAEFGPLLERRLGEDWAARQATSHFYELAAVIGAARQNARRRAAERSLAREKPQTRTNLLLQPVWIPGFGRKKYGECTAEDLDARASWLEAYAQIAITTADWLRDIATTMRTENAATLSDLKTALPRLPQTTTEPPQLLA